MLDLIDIAKIAVTAAGIMFIWINKRQIGRLIEGLVANSGISNPEGKTDRELLEEIEDAFEEVL